MHLLSLLVHLHLFIVSSQPPLDCLRIGSVSETSDSRMFELPHKFNEGRAGNSSNTTSSSNCGMHFAVGDTLCIGERELTVRRKWGLVLQLETDHHAHTGQSFTWGTCQYEDGQRRRVLMQGLHRDSRMYLDRAGQRLLVTHPIKRLVYLYHLIPSRFTHAGNRKSVDVVAGEDGKLLYPSDVALLEFNGVTSTGQPGRYYGYIVVCDRHAHRVVLYPPPGTASPANMARVIAGSSDALSGVGLSSLDSPNAIAIDPDAPLSELPYSSLFISDYGNGRIVRWRFGAVRGEIVAFADSRDLLLRPSGLFMATSTGILLLRDNNSVTCSVHLPLINQLKPDQCTVVDRNDEHSSRSMAPLRLFIDIERYPRELLREDRAKLAQRVIAVSAEASEFYKFPDAGRKSFGQSPVGIVIISDGGNQTSRGWVKTSTNVSIECGGCSELVVNPQLNGNNCIMFSIQAESGELVEWEKHDCVLQKE